MSGDELSAQFYALSKDDQALVIEYIIGHAPATFRRGLALVQTVRGGGRAPGIRLVVVDDGTLSPEDIPADFPVRPMRVGEAGKDPMTCGVCHLTWDDAVPTSWTPVPSARCPFEYFHKHD